MPTNPPNSTRNILGVIAARGGSKGVPRKNIRLLAGRPLIAYTVSAARGCDLLSRVIVSTDDDEIATVAEACGAEVPFRRPAELATDRARQIDVLIHATQWVEEHEGRPCDAIVVLQPTAPLRETADIDGAIRLFLETGADSVITLSPTIHGHPYYTYRLDGDRPEPFVPPRERDSADVRQAFPAAYVRNGAVYVVGRDVLVERRSLYGASCRGYVMPAERSINIDTPLDWKLAELLLAEQRRAA
jgi:CMP-N-acetylneuraminic acid synthetase